MNLSPNKRREMKLFNRTFLMIVMLITVISISSPTLVGAQEPEPPEILENGEFPSKLDEVNDSLIQREAQMSIDGEYDINALDTWWAASGTTFTPASSTITYSYGGVGCVDTNGASDVYRGSVNLPHGSKIIGMYFNYKNEINDPPNSSIYLTRYRFDGTYQDLLHIVGDNTGIGYQVKYLSTGTNIQVDNLNYVYALVWIGYPTQNLCGVNIRYTPPPFFAVALPLVKK